MDKKPFYITTTLPYVNAEPHIGFAMEIIRADVVARYKKLADYEVFFNTGTDEHGVKVYKKALEQDKNPQDYTNEYAEKFRDLIKILGISEDVNFIRTTDNHHLEAAKKFWEICADNGYIYKKTVHSKILRQIATVLIMFPINVMALFFSKILPPNEDLYLDNIILARKVNDV